MTEVRSFLGKSLAASSNDKGDTSLGAVTMNISDTKQVHRARMLGITIAKNVNLHNHKSLGKAQLTVNGVSGDAAYKRVPPSTVHLTSKKPDQFKQPAAITVPAKKEVKALDMPLLDIIPLDEESGDTTRNLCDNTLQMISTEKPVPILPPMVHIPAKKQRTKISMVLIPTENRASNKTPYNQPERSVFVRSPCRPARIRPPPVKNGVRKIYQITPL